VAFVTIGFVLMAVGMTALYAPYYSSFSLQNLIGSFFLIGGGMFVADAFWSRHEGRFVPEFSLGLLYFISENLLISAIAPGIELDMGADKWDRLSEHRRCSLGGTAWHTPGRCNGGDRSELQRAGNHNVCPRHAEDAGNA
jgi:hypothetical protein